MSGDLRTWLWGLAFMLGAVVVAMVGEPRGFALLVAGAGALTGALILLRGFES